MKMGNKDVIAKQLMCALQLIERQHNLIVNQWSASSCLDIIKLQSDVIDAQNRALRATEQIKKTAEDSVQSGMARAISYISVKSTQFQQEFFVNNTISILGNA